MKTTALESTRILEADVETRFLDRMLFPAVAVALLASLVLSLIIG